MIFHTPNLTDEDRTVLAIISGQRDRLRVYTQNSPKRWMGSLRRTTLARAIRASNDIEGIHASLENILAAVENDDPSDIERETWLAIRGYRDAMTYLMQAAQDPHFEFSKQFLKSLQFMMVGYDLSKNPGQWRPGSIYVVNNKTREIVYEGPDAALVNDLVEELVEYLKVPSFEPAIVKGAMAHLNLTMIHPFKDGNGRLSRALQTLVLAQEGLLHPVFSSIEEWLGREHVTPEYYRVLAEVGQGKWNPQRDALPWVRFCIKAHYHQAATLIRRNEEYDDLFAGVDKVVEQARLPERVAVPLFEAALGLSITNTGYRRAADVTDAIASRDLKRLTDIGLLKPHGEKRGRTYTRGKFLAELREDVRQDQPYADPYEFALHKSVKEDYLEPRFPGV